MSMRLDTRVIRSWIATGMGWGGDLASAFMLLAALSTTSRLWTAAQGFVTRAGGLPPDPTAWGCGPGGLGGCQAYAQAMWPGLHLRLMWWSAAWVCLVLAAGAAIVSIGGLRWAFWRIRALVAP